MDKSSLFRRSLIGRALWHRPHTAGFKPTKSVAKMSSISQSRIMRLGRPRTIPLVEMFTTLRGGEELLPGLWSFGLSHPC